MKRRMKTILLLAPFATLIAAVRDSDQTDEGLKGLWERNITSHVYLETMTDVDDDYSEKPRVSLCCHIGTFLTKDDCVEDVTNDTDAVQLPIIYGADLTSENITASDEHFSFVVWNPCAGMNRYPLLPNIYEDEVWYLLSNGSILRPLTKESEGHLLDYDQYCLATVRNKSTSTSMDNKYQKYWVFYCVDLTEEEIEEEAEEEAEEKIPYSCGMLISEPFLLTTYITSSHLLSDLKKPHSLTLREYVGCLTITYGLTMIMSLVPPEWISNDICIITALIVTFTFSASFFWLNVMCFDIWWMFREFCSIQENVKSEKKRFVMHSIYVWGSAAILVIICAIIDHGLITSPNRPEFCTYEYYWFGTDLAELLYFWGPMGVTIVCNMCLFISTAVKLVRYKKCMTHHLRDSQSRHSAEERYKLYLKLFFLMGVSWSMEVVSWAMNFICDSTSLHSWYITDLTNILQGFIIFIIFVWRKNMKQSLLKRFGCQNSCLSSRSSTSNDCHSTFSRTAITVSLQEVSLNMQTNCLAKSSSEENTTL